MTHSSAIQTGQPVIEIDHIRAELAPGDLQDLCDATEAAILDGGGFGWVAVPPRETMERYWQGVIVMPHRDLFVARLDGVICGTCQLVSPPSNNEAQSHAVTLTTHFVAPWGRGHRLARLLLQRAEKQAATNGKSVINLDVRETQGAAIALYESEGYDRYGTHPAYAHVDGRFVPGRFYMKILDKV